MLEILFEPLAEFLIQVVLEILAEVGFRPLLEPFKDRPNPWVAALGYVLFGAALGGLSLLVFPDHFVRTAAVRVVNFLVTPVIAGLCMQMLGYWRAGRGQTVVGLDRFWYGYLFALALAGVRFLLAN